MKSVNSDLAADIPKKVQRPNKKRFTPNLLLLLGGPSTWETTFAAIILALVEW